LVLLKELPASFSRSLIASSSCLVGGLLATALALRVFGIAWIKAQKLAAGKRAFY
jgi:hypothetical protein